MTSDENRQDAAIGEAQDVASATECTGLMPALPMDDAQDASSAALYDIHAAEGTRGRRSKRK